MTPSGSTPWRRAIALRPNKQEERPVPRTGDEVFRLLGNVVDAVEANANKRAIDDDPSSPAILAQVERVEVGLAGFVIQGSPRCAFR